MVRKEKGKRKHNYFLGLVIVLLLTAAAGLFSYSYACNLMLYRVNTRSVTYLKHMPTNIPKTQEIVPPSMQDLLNDSSDRNAIGRVVIPSLNMQDSIYVGLTTENLANGAVSMFPDRTPDNHNVVLLGHNMGYTSIHFGFLQNAEVGQDIYLRYLNEAYHYQISNKETILDTDIKRVDDTNYPQLTLITCSVPHETPYRIMIQAKLVNKMSVADFNKKEPVQKTITKHASVARQDLWHKSIWPLIGIWSGWLLLLIIIFWPHRKKGQLNRDEEEN